MTEEKEYVTTIHYGSGETRTFLSKEDTEGNNIIIPEVGNTIVINKTQSLIICKYIVDDLTYYKLGDGSTCEEEDLLKLLKPNL